jgi:predicted nuclease of predicted toxin-antitoxin system
MRFLADANITQKVIDLLHLAGHDVLDIKKLDQETPDIEIIKLALNENRIILTHDKDFLGLTKFPKYQVGMIVIRLKIQNATHHYKKLKFLLETKNGDTLISSLTILTEESAESYPY